MSPRRSRVPQTALRRSPHRPGFNLPELLFAVSATSALSVIVMTVVGLLVTAEQRAAEALWIDVTVSSLAADLREDAHQAITVEAEADGEGHASAVTLLLPQQTRVSYECTPEGVVRRHSREGEPEARETYRLALGSSTFLPPGEDGLLKWTHVRAVPSVGGFSESPSGDGAASRVFHVHAAVGVHSTAARKEN